jgi:Protein of unknown function (DUF3309)
MGLRLLIDDGATPMPGTFLVVLLALLLIGSLPAWPYSAERGYGPGGAVGVVLAIVLVLALLGRI